MNNLKKIPTYILTGFLGAGKTTALNHMLAKERGKRNYVIENEFGVTTVDGALVRKNYNELFELNNGCICCSLDAELMEVLAQLVQADKRPDQLFIEASGVADAGMLASVFEREDVKEYFDLIQVIAVVDAENVEDRMGEVSEIYRQLVAADLIMVNKCDLVQASYLYRLHELLRRINPFAEIRDVIQGKMPFGLKRERPSSDSAALLSLPEKEVEAGHRMKSISVEIPNPIDKDKLYTALSMTLLLHYHQVYRIKGFVRVKGEQHPFLVQSTGNKLSMERVEFEGKAPKLVLVFIGRGIERKGIERILDRVKVEEGVG